jgi:predicted RNA-binding Zn ribbon-like protein
VDFKYGTGNLALDLVGTVGHRRSDVQELLPAPADLARWVAGTGLVDRSVTVSEEGLAKAVRLREAVYHLALATINDRGHQPADRRVLNEAAAGPVVKIGLAEDGSVRRSGGLDEVLTEVARAAVELLGGPATVKECSDPQCTRLYVDNSRKQARRWCDMRSCGNRAKVAEFRARQKV